MAILSSLTTAIIAGDHAATVRLTGEAIAAGVTPEDIITKGP
jgi:methanogenic corrinoid protein MtbC1